MPRIGIETRLSTVHLTPGSRSTWFAGPYGSAPAHEPGLSAVVESPGEISELALFLTCVRLDPDAMLAAHTVPFACVVTVTPVVVRAGTVVLGPHVTVPVSSPHHPRLFDMLSRLEPLETPMALLAGDQLAFRVVIEGNVSGSLTLTLRV